jgi:hypothetical protein
MTEDKYKYRVCLQLLANQLILFYIMNPPPLKYRSDAMGKFKNKRRVGVP